MQKETQSLPDRLHETKKVSLTLLNQTLKKTGNAKGKVE